MSFDPCAPRVGRKRQSGASNLAARLGSLGRQLVGTRKLSDHSFVHEHALFGQRGAQPGLDVGGLIAESQLLRIELDLVDQL